MFGKVVYVSDNSAHVKITDKESLATNLLNFHVVFESDGKRILGEIDDISEDLIKVEFLGEFIGNRFVGGILNKPSLSSTIRVINKEEIALIVGETSPGSMELGVSPLYDGCSIMLDINHFFSNHMAIFGNTGSGKSCGVARLVQNLFSNKNFLPYRANIFIFDAYSEYHNAFKDINKINPNYNFKYYSTEDEATSENKLRIPLWLLEVDDLALLLNANDHAQLPIIERMLKLANIFAGKSEDALRYKNHLIASAIMAILFTNQTSPAKRNDVFSILASCSTPQFNLEAPVQGIGYTRSFRDCFIIDTAGQFPESNLMTKYVSSFIDDKLNEYDPDEINYYTLDDLEKALSFTLISEGLLRNEKAFNSAITLKVRLHSLAISKEAEFFTYPTFITMQNYIASLVTLGTKKAQIVNFNLADIDDSLAKVITKIFTKMLFKFTKDLGTRASIPFHIFLEESHRYVQNDGDRFLIGYNIFERVAKEGRKYGLMLNLISQRPVELSDTVISQVSNFLIFRMNHPRDIEYIRKMLPNISSEIVEKQKSLQPGTCVAFGKAFKVPMIVKMEMPDPEPYSANCDVVQSWAVNQ
ncbi:MAG: ATP-binding protein [Bacilli bacterium]|nr:ATP-binding protein [Bacilli bacterium]MDD4607751.1 ATP-binding protein [Bacilli bacterium]